MKTRNHKYGHITTPRWNSLESISFYLISLCFTCSYLSVETPMNPVILLLIFSKHITSQLNKTLTKAVGHQNFLYYKQTFPAGSLKYWWKDTKVAHALGATLDHLPCRQHTVQSLLPIPSHPLNLCCTGAFALVFWVFLFKGLALFAN